MPVFNLTDVAAAAAIPLRKLEQRVANTATLSATSASLRVSQPGSELGQCFRGECWSCGHVTVDVFRYDVCTECAKPGMEWFP